MLSQSSFPSADELRVVISEVMRVELNNFRQEMIASIRSELAELRTTIGDLNERVCQLEANPPGLKDGQPSGSVATDEVVVEINKRKFRAMNVIIHGLPKSNNTSPDVARRDDTEGVKLIFRFYHRIIRIYGYIDLGN